MPIAINVIGSKGRMGSQVVALAKTFDEFKVEECVENADVIIDFSSHLAIKKTLSQATLLKKPLVIGTTGHSTENYSSIETAAQEIPVLFSPNFSLGMAACLDAATLLAKRLKGYCSINIVEAHHVHKKDKPSGSACALEKAMNEKDIPIHSIRAGDIIGDHRVIFSCEGEQIELQHTVHSRNAFAKGALKAASFLINKHPRLYSIKDLFS